MGLTQGFYHLPRILVGSGPIFSFLFSFLFSFFFSLFPRDGRAREEGSI
jgi:hypothetical protein